MAFTANLDTANTHEPLLPLLYRVCAVGLTTSTNLAANGKVGSKTTDYLLVLKAAELSSDPQLTNEPVVFWTCGQKSSFLTFICALS